MGKKLTLEDLKLESFLTELDSTKIIKGGNGTTTDYTGDDTDPYSDQNCDTYDDCMPSLDRGCDTQANCPSLNVSDCEEWEWTYGAACDGSQDICQDQTVDTACGGCEDTPGYDTDQPGCGSATGQPCFGCH